MAFMWYQGHTFESKLFPFNFAVASSVINHTIHGNGNITGDVESIRKVTDTNFDIKR